LIVVEKLYVRDVGRADQVVVVAAPFEAFSLTVDRAGARPSGAQARLAQRVAVLFRLGLGAGDAAIARAALDVVALLADGFVFSPVDRRELDPASAPSLADFLEQQLAGGRVVVRALAVPSLSDRRPLAVPELPPLPPARRESATRSFEARFLDEIGKPISGIEVELTADGVQTLSTNAGGVALLDGVSASSAKVAVPDADALAKLLDSRWQGFRRGQPPKESNLQEVVFRGQDLGPFALKAEIPNTIVIKPPLGKLFVELSDKTGLSRHARRTYQISGPQQFEGETGDDGRLVHDVVFPGDYRLSLALEFFEEGDPDRAVDIVESPLVVLAPAEAEPEVRLLGAVPRSVLARLHFFFNTNKAFLLPSALPSVKKLRRIYLDNAPCRLLVVGHADTTGAPAYNDKLSLSRAEATIAYLRDDVDGWLAFYGQAVEAKQRWGKVEDRLMITAMPGFATKIRSEDAVRWYQRTRDLEVDGVAGPQTRRALVTEYMSLDGASLSDFVGDIEATAHGCGENFPLDDTGDELDAAPADDRRDPTDRRVELFFFDPEFGITPPPAGTNSAAGSREYPLWRKRVAAVVELEAGDADAPDVTFAEISDGHFRTDSAVVLPEGEDPDAAGGHAALSSVGLIAQALRFNEEHEGRTLLVAGHTDTSAGDAYNDELSRQRAKVALALLEGDRESFSALCHERHQAADINQILSWVSRAFEDLDFAGDPGQITSFVDPVNVRGFQTDFNRHKLALGSTAADLAVDGSVGKLTWGAFFDCYEFALQEELGEDAAAVAALRGKLKFVDPERKALGFGEHFPIEELGVDDFRSQTNRRVEILFFESGAEPDVPAAEADAETSELYLPGFYQRTPLEPMLSAKPFRAEWDAVTTQVGTARSMNVTTPGLPAGTPATLTLVINGEPFGLFVTSSGDGSVTLTYDAWEVPDEIIPVDLDAGVPFPRVSYEFFLEAGGRRVASRNAVVYADSLLVNLVLDPADDEAEFALADEPYELRTPFGRRRGRTDAQGVVDEKDLPPGGVSLLVRGRHLFHVGSVPYNWDMDE
jgi:outer membrane protein OmpA-like peptidoglycan-associated protein